MKHTHTHPNWKNLTDSEKQTVRKRNHAAASNKKIIEKYEKLLDDPDCFEKENLKYNLSKRKHPDYDPLFGTVKGMSITDDFTNTIMIAIKQYHLATKNN